MQKSKKMRLFSTCFFPQVSRCRSNKGATSSTAATPQCQPVMDPAHLPVRLPMQLGSRQLFLSPQSLSWPQLYPTHIEEEMIGNISRRTCRDPFITACARTRCWLAGQCTKRPSRAKSSRRTWPAARRRPAGSANGRRRWPRVCFVFVSQPLLMHGAPQPQRQRPRASTRPPLHAPTPPPAPAPRS